MTQIKSYTDFKQSRQLEKFLPLESADMCYIAHSELVGIHEPFCKKVDKKEDTPCWSLATLFDILPQRISYRLGTELMLEFKFVGDKYHLFYRSLYSTEPNRTPDYFMVEEDTFVDACYEMIVKLNELNLL